MDGLPELKKYPELYRAFDAEISFARRNTASSSCSKCQNNAILKIVRKYQKLLNDVKKS
jgi:hypothetical protein